MSVTQFPVKKTQPNTSQVFTASGSFTVPSGVTAVHVSARGGDGSHASYTSQGNQTAAAGGTSSAGTVSAPGGVGGRVGVYNSAQGWQTSAGPVNGCFIQAWLAVTPGDTVTVTVGSGTGAHVVISWAS